MTTNNTIVSEERLIEIFEGIVINCRYQREKIVIDMIKKYAYYTTNDNRSIFTLEYAEDDNDLLATCCINKLVNAATVIIFDYAELFDVGSANPLGQTALILAIINDLFSFVEDLLNTFLEDCNPLQLTNGNNQLSALDYMLQKNKHIIAENIDIVVDLLDFYIEHDPHSQVFHRNIDIICREIEFYKPLLEPYFSKRRLDLNKRFCKEPVNTEVGTFRDFHTNLPNTRGMENIRINAQPINLQMGIPTHDRNFTHEYTREEEDNFRINKRQRTEDTAIPNEPNENRGGTKHGKLKKPKKNKTTKNKKGKQTKHKKCQNKTKFRRSLTY
jgi:hypothetical protein